jgi:DNA-binding transcriptional LysR family regulator
MNILTTRLGMKREHGMSIHNYFDAPQVLTQTDMVCTMPKTLGRHFARVHGLKMVQSPLQLELPVFMLWPSNLDKDKGHRWLRDALIDTFRREEQLAE